MRRNHFEIRRLLIWLCIRIEFICGISVGESRLWNEHNFLAFGGGNFYLSECTVHVFLNITHITNNTNMEFSKLD